MRFWLGLVAHPDRYIIHRNEGLIQVIRPRLPLARQEDADRGAAFHTKRFLSWRSVLDAGAAAGFDRFQDRIEHGGVVAGQKRQRQRRLLGVEGRNAGQVLAGAGALFFWAGSRNR
jgi:hypothetical protein